MPTFEIAVLAFCAAPCLATVLFYCEAVLERRLRKRLGLRAQQRFPADGCTDTQLQGSAHMAAGSPARNARLPGEASGSARHLDPSKTDSRSNARADERADPESPSPLHTANSGRFKQRAAGILDFGDEARLNRLRANGFYQ
jgi:hypothetical protein